MFATLPGGRLPVAVLGATGGVGQRLVALLEEHPWFELAALCASPRSAGRPYGEVVRWGLPGEPPTRVAGRRVLPPEPIEGVPLVLSALDARVAGEVERAWAEVGAFVVSNARSHRLHPDVPLVVPEVNPEHLALLERQSFGAGRIVTNPNCSTIGLTLALAPWHRAFGVRRVSVVTLQAISGAGLSGPRAHELVDNLVPAIPGEEEKIEVESRRILGALGEHGVVPADLVVSAQTNRVPVLEGHTACVSVELARDADEAGLLAAWREFRGPPQELGLPSAPERPVRVHLAPDAPQPRRVRDLDRGMSAHVGRLRPCPLLGWRFVTVSHNTLRGAAGGALLLAELCVARGLVAGVAPPSA